MGEGKKIMPVTSSSGRTEDIMLLLMIAAELQPLLYDADVGLQGGIILFTEKNEEGECLIKMLERAGAINCKSLKKGTEALRNNQLGIHGYRLYEKQEEIQNFRDSEGFTPCVFVHGLLPSFFREEQNLLPIPQFMKDSFGDFADKIREFSDYAHKNPSVMQRSIRLFHTSTDAKESQVENPLYRALLVAANCYCEFYRESASQLQTKWKRQNFIRTIQQFEALAETYSEECEALVAVRMAVYDYVDNHPEVSIREMMKLEGEHLKAVQNGNGILFDSDFYFIPEKLLRSACGNLLQSVSFPEIKRELYNAGALFCNEGKVQNFTTKVLLTDVYGHCFRIRFLKIRREFFETEKELGLQERRKKSCMSENYTGTVVTQVIES